MCGHFLEQGAFEGRRWSTNAKRLFIYIYMGTLFVDVNSRLHLSTRLDAGAGADAGACAGTGADADPGADADA